MSFLLDFASEMVYPIVPLFLDSILKAPGRALGLIEGAADALLSLVTAGSGVWSDRMRRRVPFIRAGYALAAGSKPLIGLAGSWPTVLGLRLLDRLGKGLRTSARDALIVDLVPPAQRGAAFGFHRAMDTSGAVCGVLFALAWLHFAPGEYRLAFLFTAIPGAAAIALTFTLREAPPRTDGSAAADEARSAAPRPPLSREFRRAAALLWLFALADSSDAFLLLNARRAGLSDVAVVALYALMNVVYAVSSYPAGRLSDRLGRVRVLTCGFALYALCYVGFATLDPSHFAWLFVGYGVYLGMTQGVVRAYVADLAPPELRATALGIFQVGRGFGVLAASAGAGFLFDWYGRAAPFLTCAAIAAFAALAFGMLAPRRGVHSAECLP